MNINFVRFFSSTYTTRSVLNDTFGRFHNYLRISLTERCNLRCQYCMPEKGVELTPNSKLLSTEELKFVCAQFVKFGVQKIRLTGGEPFLRADIIPILEFLSTLRQEKCEPNDESLGLESIGATTNGLLLKRYLNRIYDQRLLDCINISLDTLVAAKYQLITRRDGFASVWRTIISAEEMISPKFRIKINCVVMRGFNDEEILDFVELTKDMQLDVRFIEYMPFSGNQWSMKKMVFYKTMLERIRQKFPDLEKLADSSNDTSKAFAVPGYRGQIGFISSMSEHFCHTCNRLRLMADGSIKVCLHGAAEISLREYLRSCSSPLDFTTIDQGLLDLVSSALSRKKRQHAGMENLARMDNRPMILIGG